MVGSDRKTEIRDKKTLVSQYLKKLFLIDNNSIVVQVVTIIIKSSFVCFIRSSKSCNIKMLIASLQKILQLLLDSIKQTYSKSKSP